MDARRRLCIAATLSLALGYAAALQADTTLDQGAMSSSLFRKMRAVQNMIRGGQYSDALTQLSYLQGVTTNAYEAAVVRQLSSDLYIARGDYASALAALQPVVQQNILPANAQREAQLALAKLLVSNGQYQAGLDAAHAWMLGQDNPPPDARIAWAGNLGSTRSTSTRSPTASTGWA